MVMTGRHGSNLSQNNIMYEVKVFEKNLSALEKRNQELIDKIKNCQSQDIGIMKTLSEDVNISYKNIPLHSTIDPITEAYELYKNLKMDNNYSVVIIFGLGLGYLLKRIHMEFTGQIILYEPNLDVLRFTVENVDFADIYQDPRVTVCTTVDQVFEAFNTIYLKGDLLAFTYLPSYQHTNINELTEVLARFEKILLDINKMKTEDFSELKTLQNVFNFKFYQDCQPVEILEYKYAGYNALVIGSGPSLDDQISLIQQNQGKFVVLSTLSALKPLLNNNIHPDFVVVNNIVNVEQYLQGVDTSSLSFILTSYCDSKIFSFPSQAKFIHFEQDESLSGAFPKVQKWFISPFSAMLAYLLGIKMGFESIVFCGQDLCFSQDKVCATYSFGEHWQVHMQEDNRSAHVMDEHQNDVIDPAYLKLMKQTDSDKTYVTTVQFLRQKRYLESINRQLLPDTTYVFNTSPVCMAIDGVQSKSLEEVITSLTFDQETKPIPQEIFSNAEDNFNTYYTSFVMFYSKCYKESINLESKLNFAANFGTNILEEYQLTHNAQPSSYSNYSTYQGEMAFIRQFLTENPLYIAGTKKITLQYIGEYITPDKAGTVNLTIEDIMHNIETDLRYIKQLMVFTGKILSLLRTEIKINAIEVNQ